MTTSIFSIRLHEARLMAGLSMDKLVELTGGVVSKQSISRYEKGVMLPKRVARLALAKALNISDDYFSGTNICIDVPALRTSVGTCLSEEELLSLEAKLAFWTEQYIAKEQKADYHNPFRNPIPDAKVQTKDDIMQAVERLRESWHCGDGPIPSILRLLERKGIKVMEAKLPGGILGLSTWADKKYPLIVIDMRPEKATVERIRFTAAHELAHLLLQFPEDSLYPVEKRCDLFAGFFILSKAACIEELGSTHRDRVTLEEMIDIKTNYGISIAALIIQLRNYGIITSEYKRYFYEMYPQKNNKEIGWGHYPYPETVGRERRIESLTEKNK